MIKSFLILISFSVLLVASKQIILVVADDFNTSKAKLECYEDSKKIFQTIDVNLGKNGLGWGLGEIKLQQQLTDSIKYEGDKKAPSGIFRLSSVFGYKENMNIDMPYIYASKELICVDDVKSSDYNKIISITKDKPTSFEYMKREDSQYELGVVVEHNVDSLYKRGSCIFLHVEKKFEKATAGCTSMTLENLEKIISWLDERKEPILIQIQKSSSKEILQKYPELKNSKLLQGH